MALPQRATAQANAHFPLSCANDTSYPVPYPGDSALNAVNHLTGDDLTAPCSGIGSYGKTVWASRWPIQQPGISGDENLFEDSRIFGVVRTGPSVSYGEGAGVDRTGALGLGKYAIYKTDVESRAHRLEALMKMGGVSFDWRANEYPNQEIDPARVLVPVVALAVIVGGIGLGVLALRRRRRPPSYRRWRLGRIRQ
jgi:hypothetical protein